MRPACPDPNKPLGTSPLGSVSEDANGTAPTPAAAWKMAQGFYAPVLEQESHSAAYVIQHHGRVLFGTDTPSAPSYANLPGLNGFIEMHRLVAVGMTRAQVLRAARLSKWCCGGRVIDSAELVANRAPRP